MISDIKWQRIDWFVPVYASCSKASTAIPVTQMDTQIEVRWATLLNIALLSPTKQTVAGERVEIGQPVGHDVRAGCILDSAVWTSMMITEHVMHISMLASSALQEGSPEKQQCQYVPRSVLSYGQYYYCY